MRRLIIMAACIAAAIPVFATAFDLKVGLGDKALLAPLHAGAEYYLLNAGQEVADFGEDYSVWLIDPRVVADGDSRAMSVTVELGPTTALGRKPALASQRISFRYRVAPSESVGTDEAATVFIRKRLSKIGRDALELGKVGGEAVARTAMALAAKAGKE